MANFHTNMTRIITDINHNITGVERKKALFVGTVSKGLTEELKYQLYLMNHGRY